MALGALVLLLRPFFRSHKRAVSRASYDLEVYREQLKELHFDNTRGLISDQDHEAAQTEIERRILVAGGARDLENHTPEKKTWGQWKILLLMIVAVPLFAASLYQTLGSPQLKDEPLAARGLDNQNVGQGEFDQAIEGLVARLKENPNEVEGWILLARTYAFVGRFGDAVSAYREAIALSPQDNDLVTAMGEAIVFSREGMVTPAARRQFEDVLASDPSHQIARYYLGLAHAQTGARENAFAIWSELALDADPGEPWVPQLQKQLAELSEELGRMVPEVANAGALENKPESTSSAGSSGPTAADIEAAGAMSDGDRADMIQSMVERLANRLEANPEDPEGWKRLGNARRVLGELPAAVKAYGRALSITPTDIIALIAQAEISMEIMASGIVPPIAENNYRKVRELDANHLEALWYLGLAASQKGLQEDAKEYWQILLDKLPENSNDARAVQKQLDELR